MMIKFSFFDGLVFFLHNGFTFSDVTAYFYYVLSYFYDLYDLCKLFLGIIEVTFITISEVI